MSFVQNRVLGGGFAQPLAPSGGSISTTTSSSVLFNRSAQRDPFMFSSPVTSSTMPGSGGIFLSPSVNSHTGFRPTRIGSAKLEAPSMKPPKPPEKPLMPYMRYSRKMWEKVRAGNPESKLWDIGKIIGQMWRDLPEGARQAYTEEYETEKQEYDRALKAYHNSPAYQAYLQSKNKGVRSNEKSSAVSISESGVYIQPVDEDEGDYAQFSLRQMAASRFHRNHRLMKEIFNETQVPDSRNVITTQRLGVLKKQVNSLTLHQNKLEDELKQLEVRFEGKKIKMSESSTQFATALNQIATQKKEPFENLVERSRVHLLSAYEQYKHRLLQQQKEQELAAAAVQNEVHDAPQPTSPVATETDDVEAADTAEAPTDNISEAQIENGQEAVPEEQAEEEETKASPARRKNSPEPAAKGKKKTSKRKKEEASSRSPRSSPKARARDKTSDHPTPAKRARLRTNSSGNSTPPREEAEEEKEDDRKEETTKADVGAESREDSNENSQEA